MLVSCIELLDGRVKKTGPLYRICLSKLAKVIETEDPTHIYGKQCCLELPRHVIWDLIFYLSPMKLFFLEGHLSEAGIDTENLWKIYLKNRWSYKYQKQPEILKCNSKQQQSEKRSFHRYMQSHFCDVFQYYMCSGSSHEDILKRGLQLMLTSHYDYTIGNLCQEVSLKDGKVLTDLSYFSPFVNRFVLFARQCHDLLHVQASLLLLLRENVHRLDLHMLKDKWLDDTIEIVKYLMCNGKLNEVNLFHPHLQLVSLRKFLHVCAGHFHESIELLEQDFRLEGCIILL